MKKIKSTNMQQKMFSLQRTGLRISLGLSILLLAGWSLVSYKTHKMEEEIWSQLGLTKEDGNTSISNSFLQGYLHYYDARKVKSIAAGNRSVIVKELAAYAKQYVSSEAFKKEYLVLRESSKPEPPPAPKTLEQIRTEQKEGYQKSIREMEPLLKSTNADLRKAAREGIDFLQKQLEDTDDPKNELLKAMADGEKSNHENQTQDYKLKMESWEKDYPSSQMALVKTRLQEFLASTDGVDFSASLKEQNGKKRFVNPDYESKDPEWKQAFRAGKDATETARTFARQWLKELN